MDDAEETRLRDALRRGLERVRGIAAAWLFGSHASGRARAESDIDVAVLMSDTAGRPAPSSRLATFRGLLDALGDELDTSRVHLVLLDPETPVALAFQVLARGEPLLVQDRVATHRFTVRVYREHGDREHVERFFREATKARALKAASHG